MIGRPVLLKSSSRHPLRPSLQYANPASSGGIMVDMGIHDFDLARWFMGDVDTVLAAGAVLAYPEMASIGDIDNAIATDRKSTRLNSSHLVISYAVFCLKKKKTKKLNDTIIHIKL